VIELEHGITVYPARFEGDRWRAVWYEDGERQQCEAVTEDRLAGRLEKVSERLAADAPNMRRPGADLIAHYPAGWRDSSREGRWTWHSLRHVFCTTALFTWKLDATDVSRMAGHANVRITLDMYVGATAGVLDRARAATE
jgi:hypothetical protein